MAKRALLVSAIIFVTVAVATSSAQVSSQWIASGSGFSGSATFGAIERFAPPVVTGAPYSGEEVNENIKILTDGTRITQKNPGRKVWRDSEGRTRTERPLGMGPGMGLRQASAPATPLIVEINDPVAGYRYTLDTANKVAHRQALPAPMTPATLRAATAGNGPAVRGGSFSATLPPPGGSGGGGRVGEIVAPPRPPAADTSPRPRSSHESLGTQTIDGVYAEGTRNTTTYPVGMMGNDREFSVVMENWMSPDLKIQIFSKNNDPRSGENTFRIENLSRDLPDPTLFMVPTDYTVVDETGGFTINFKGQ